MFRLAHISKNEFSIEQNLRDKKLKKKRNIEKDGIVAQHKVSEIIKGFRNKTFYFHTLFIINHVRNHLPWSTSRRVL